MQTNLKRLPAAFYRTLGGAEPVRDWLKELPDEDRKVIGDDIRDCEFAWPIGLPLCRAMKTRPPLFEVRSNLPGNRISRVLFCVSGGEMMLLHGFIKKTQKTPTKELELAIKRAKEVKAHE